MAARVCTVVWRSAIGFGQGGYLELESAPGKVTTFHVYFVSLICAANIRAGEAVAGRGSGGGAQYVLDVDVDDKVMLSLAERLLERAGCRVSTGLVSKELWHGFERSARALMRREFSFEEPVLAGS